MNLVNNFPILLNASVDDAASLYSTLLPMMVTGYCSKRSLDDFSNPNCMCWNVDYPSASSNSAYNLPFQLI